MIRDFVGDGSRFRHRGRSTAIDGPKLLGTGGALRAALPHLGDEFLVMYGDSWLDTPFAPIVEAFRASGKPALMTVFRNEGQWDTSNVWFEDGRIRLYDKRERLPQMQHIDWGLSVAEIHHSSRPADRQALRPGRRLHGPVAAGRARRLRGEDAILRDRFPARPTRNRCRNPRCTLDLQREGLLSIADLGLTYVADFRS